MPLIKERTDCRKIPGKLSKLMHGNLPKQGDVIVRF